MRWKRGGGPGVRNRKFTGRAKRVSADGGPTEQVMRILAAVRRIPRGRVATYGDVATAAGLSRRARLVGRVLRVEPLASTVPWFRVVSAGGRIAIPDDAGAREQMRRLGAEGIAFSGRRIVGFSRVRQAAGRRLR